MPEWDGHANRTEVTAVLEDEPWQMLLREALAVLALPVDEQVRVRVPGCVACELLKTRCT